MAESIIRVPQHETQSRIPQKNVLGRDPLSLSQSTNQESLPKNYPHKPFKNINGDIVESTGMPVVDVANKSFDHLKRLEAAASKDQLTGLYNRAYFERKLKAFDPNINHSIGVIFMDLNYLKRANDNYGYIVGDALIKGAAEVLKEIFRSQDTLSFVTNEDESQINKHQKEPQKNPQENPQEEPQEEPLFRPGGDELIALCPNLNKRPDFSEIFPDTIYTRLIKYVSEFNQNHPDLPIPLSISLGVAVYDQNKDSSNILNTLKRAENAMKQHKSFMKAGRE